MTKESIEFGDKEYTKELIASMKIEELLTLRNEVAKYLKDSAIKEFKDNTEAKAQTWAILNNYSTKPADKKIEKKERVYVVPKGARSHEIFRPSKRMFRKIKKLTETPKRDFNRFHLYEDGMTILHILETEGLCHTDIPYFVRQKEMEVSPDVSDEEYRKLVSAWCESKGKENPLLKKQEKAEAEKAEKAKKAEAAKQLAEERKKKAAEEKTKKEKEDYPKECSIEGSKNVA